VPQKHMSTPSWLIPCCSSSPSSCTTSDR
jgi:hypothetical protein